MKNMKKAKSNEGGTDDKLGSVNASKFIKHEDLLAIDGEEYTLADSGNNAVGSKIKATAPFYYRRTPKIYFPI